jgi:hypothetical protein
MRKIGSLILFAGLVLHTLVRAKLQTLTYVVTRQEYCISDHRAVIGFTGPIEAQDRSPQA